MANTTVATMLKVMHDKRLVKRACGPRGYLWSAAVTRRAAASGLVGKLLDRVFDGSAQRLVAHLLEAGELSAEDRRELGHLLEADRKRNKSKRKT